MMSNEAIEYMYCHGLGLEEDVDEAIKWYEKSGDNSKSRAFEEIASMYLKDLDNPENYSNGIKWYIKAAELGSPQAIEYLLKEYMNHQVRNPDFSLVVDLFQNLANS